MPELTLYSARACPFAHRTRLVLSHKKTDFELVEIDLQKKPPWFRSVSGYGKVPAIDHRGNRIWESAIVNEYIEEVFALPALLPREPARRAVARIWIDWANTRLVPSFGALLRGHAPAERENARRELGGALAYLEQEGFGRQNEAGPFFFGDRVSLVDFTLYPWFERWAALDHYRAFAFPLDLERLGRWRTELSALPAVRAQENPAEYYIERYARLTAPPAKAPSA